MELVGKRDAAVAVMLELPGINAQPHTPGHGNFVEVAVGGWQSRVHLTLGGGQTFFRANDWP